MKFWVEFEAKRLDDSVWRRLVNLRTAYLD